MGQARYSPLGAQSVQRLGTSLEVRRILIRGEVDILGGQRRPVELCGDAPDEDERHVVVGENRRERGRVRPGVVWAADDRGTPERPPHTQARC